MEWQTVERKISHQTPLNVDELDWAFDVYESRCSYWVASKILSHRKGEDTYPAEEQLKEITRDIDRNRSGDVDEFNNKLSSTIRKEALSNRAQESRGGMNSTHLALEKSKPKM